MQFQYHIYIETIRISSILKNKRQTKEILIFNTQNTNYNKIKNLYNDSYSQWEDAGNYVVLRLDSIDFETLLSNDFMKKEKRLYRKFNKKGTIFAGFSRFTPSYKNGNKHLKSFRFFGIVNPSYLKKFPVYDDDDNKISVLESNKNWVMLVPNTFKNKEKGIRKLYQYFIDSHQDVNLRKLEIV